MEGGVVIGRDKEVEEEWEGERQEEGEEQGKKEGRKQNNGQQRSFVLTTLTFLAPYTKPKVEPC